MKFHSTTVRLSLCLTLVLTCLLNLPLLPPAATPSSGNATPPRTAAIAAAQPRATDAMPEAERTTDEQAREAYGKLELQFEANRGQTDSSVNFLARGAGYTMFLKPAETVFVLNGRGSGNATARGAQKQLDGDAPLASSAGKTPAQTAPAPAEAAVLRMKLVGADASAAVAAADELAGKVNYFKGDDPAEWRANVPTFGRVRYKEVYPGIDVVYYGNQRQLEYDFVIAPGRDARAVSLQFEGADKVETDARGDLLLTLGDDVIRQPKPFVYQELAGARREIEGGYLVGANGRVGFAVGEYDARLPLVIDPVLIYSTYLGGSGGDAALAIAVDPSGNAYVSGYTTSTNFPTANAIQAAHGTGFQDAFVTKINAAGNGFVYSTYLGGNAVEQSRGIAADSAGNAYVVGQTNSPNFPTANAIKATKGSNGEDVFVTKLNSTGSALIYSTFLGGTDPEFGEGITLDSSGNAYITGTTFSTNFPTLNPFQTTKTGSTEAFITKINAAGNALVYSTLLGGAGSDIGHDIAVDGAGNAYVTGDTSSNNFPTANALQATYGGGTNLLDGFVTKINAAGNALVYSTYLGGSDDDGGYGVAVDSAGNTYVGGFTFSTNFPTANALQGANGGGASHQDGFVTKINAAGNAFVYSTYLGGLGGEIVYNIAVDSAGSVYLAGGTGSSTTFPTANAIQCTNAGGADAFIAKLDAAGAALIYSTYFGGNDTDDARDIALDSSGNAYVAGTTRSPNLPTANAIQGTFGGDAPIAGDAFVAKFNDALSPNACATPTPTPTPTPPPAVVQFAQAAYTVAEGMERDTDPASLVLTVSRTGNTSAASTVGYRTLDLSDAVRCDTANGTAYHRCDYATTLGTLSFAAGETSKTFSVFITDDAHVEGAETFQITLTSASGATLGTQSTATVTIQDNDLQLSNVNPIDMSEFFIRQHYVDFLSRAPEPTGFAAWVGALNACGAGSGDRGRDPSCDRLMVSSGFFRSAEFLQVKGYFAYRFYEVAFGRRPTYMEFARDLQRLTGTTPQDALERQAAFAVEFTARQEFLDAYQAAMPLNVYVDTLFNTAEIGDRQSITRQDGTVLTRAQLADGSRTRADILREIVESREVSAIFYNRAFVAAQYFGYLRRDPESPGYEMWLAYLNANPTDFRTMINGFLNSVEYRLRFGRPN